MSGGRGQRVEEGLLKIEDCVDAEGDIVLPPGVTLISLIDRNIAAVGEAVAYRYLDHTGTDDVRVAELTWTELGVRLRAIGGPRLASRSPTGRSARICSTRTCSR